VWWGSLRPLSALFHRYKKCAACINKGLDNSWFRRGSHCGLHPTLHLATIWVFQRVEQKWSQLGFGTIFFLRVSGEDLCRRKRWRQARMINVFLLLREADSLSADESKQTLSSILSSFIKRAQLALTIPQRASAYSFCRRCDKSTWKVLWTNLADKSRADNSCRQLLPTEMGDKRLNKYLIYRMRAPVSI
jgi:hypothetical protein